MELCIVRHGQSTNNALTDPQDRLCDPPLTELGWLQAEIVAQHLATGSRLTLWEEGSSNQQGFGITRLCCSPMWRALQTAQYIGRALKSAPEVWIDLHEHGGIFLDHGEAEGVVGYPGKTRTEILAEFPDYVLPEGITEQGWWHYPGHEEISAFYGRAIKVAEALRKRAAHDEQASRRERIAMVSHGGFIAALLRALLGQLPDSGVYYRHFNTSISWIGFRANGHLHVEYLNRVDHLPLELIS
jgi:2,3-bisphosphoglycerate-dependent phosphoglycerate mutase